MLVVLGVRDGQRLLRLAHSFFVSSSSSATPGQAAPQGVPRCDRAVDVSEELRRRAVGEALGERELGRRGKGRRRDRSRRGRRRGLGEPRLLQRGDDRVDELGIEPHLDRARDDGGRRCLR